MAMKSVCLDPLHPATINYIYRPDGFRTPIYMTVICVRHDCARGSVAFESWGQDFVNRFPTSKLSFVFSGQNQVLEPYSLHYEGSFQSFRDIYKMNEFAMLDFLNTSYNWFIRTTYDCYVHVDSLKRFIDEIESKYTPRQFVMQGQILDTDNITFIHGGSGWIMSRYAVESWFRHKDHLDRVYERNIYWGDDVLVDEFYRVIHGMTKREIMNPHFIGPQTEEEDLRHLARKRTAYITWPKCVHPVRTLVKNIVFWHGGRPHIIQLKEGGRLIRAAPPDLYIQTQYYGSSFCVL